MGGRGFLSRILSSPISLFCMRGAAAGKPPFPVGAQRTPLLVGAQRTPFPVGAKNDAAPGRRSCYFLSRLASSITFSAQCGGTMS